MYILGAIELILQYSNVEEEFFLMYMRMFGTLLLAVMAFLVFVGVKYVTRFAAVCCFCDKFENKSRGRQTNSCLL